MPPLLGRNNLVRPDICVMLIVKYCANNVDPKKCRDGTYSLKILHERLVLIIMLPPKVQFVASKNLCLTWSNKCLHTMCMHLIEKLNWFGMKEATSLAVKTTIYALYQQYTNRCRLTPFLWLPQNSFLWNINLVSPKCGGRMLRHGCRYMSSVWLTCYRCRAKTNLATSSILNQNSNRDAGYVSLSKDVVQTRAHFHIRFSFIHAIQLRQKYHSEDGLT